MHAHIGGTGAAGTNGVEQRQVPVSPMDGKCADRAFLVVAHPIRLIGGIQAGSSGIQSQAAGAGAHLDDRRRRHRPRGTIHLKEVNAATIAGWQIHLGWQDIAERRTKGPDIGDERLGGFARIRRVTNLPSRVMSPPERQMFLRTNAGNDRVESC